MQDYSMMLGIIESWTDEKLDSVISEYEAAQEEAAKEYNSANNKISFFNRNVSGLKRMRQERYERSLRDNFKLKKEHLLLLSQMGFRNYKDGGDFVWLGVDGKRPFGNSCVDKDIAEILGLKYGDNGFGDKEDYVSKLLDELPLAIEYLIKKELK